MTCDVCYRELDQDKGEVFLTDDGGTFCNDHFPEVDLMDDLVN
jgi:hypothetical protein